VVKVRISDFIVMLILAALVLVSRCWWYATLD
jgi:hypothetical protein